eukprot:UN2426
MNTSWPLWSNVRSSGCAFLLATRGQPSQAPKMERPPVVFTPTPTPRLATHKCNFKEVESQRELIGVPPATNLRTSLTASSVTSSKPWKSSLSDSQGP